MCHAWIKANVVPMLHKSFGFVTAVQQGSPLNMNQLNRGGVMENFLEYLRGKVRKLDRVTLTGY
jgi:hypothetical protein